MKVVNVNDIYGTDREVDCPNGGFKSLRILLEKDNMGFTLTKTLIPKGTPQRWHYLNHLEACYCIEGLGYITDLKNNKTYKISPDTVYVLDNHDEHEFVAAENTILICVFNPPLKGKEVHNKDGAYDK